jgi:hypothetical protein
MQVELAAVYGHNGELEDALARVPTGPQNPGEASQPDCGIRRPTLNSEFCMNSAELFAGLMLVALRMHRAAALSLYNNSPASHDLQGEVLAVTRLASRRAGSSSPVASYADTRGTTLLGNNISYGRYYDLRQNRRSDRMGTDRSRTIALGLEDLRDRQKKRNPDSAKWGESTERTKTINPG